MNVRPLGASLLFALIAFPVIAQDAPPAHPPPVAVQAPPPFPPPVVDEPGPKTSIVIEPADTRPPSKGSEEPAAVKSLWRYGDGGEYLLWYIKNSRVPS